MKMYEFKYRKPGDSFSEKRRIIVLSEDSDHIAGIDLDKLTTDEQNEIKKAFDSFQEIVSKVMNKSFRNFKKDAIFSA